MSSTQFWRESKVAFETKLYSKFWELPKEDQAWLIAFIETKDTLQQAVDAAYDSEK